MLRELRLRIRALRKRRQLEQDLEDELAYHMELRQAAARAPFDELAPHPGSGQTMPRVTGLVVLHSGYPEQAMNLPKRPCLITIG